MIVGPLNRRLQVVRRVTIGADRSVNIDLAPSEVFSAHFANTEGGGSDQSPRESLARTPIYTPHSALVARTFNVGDRLLDIVHGSVWEVVEKSEPIKSGFLHVYDRALIVPLDPLYPFIGAIEDQGGTVITNAVRCSIWQDDESQEERGRYESFNGEVPIEHIAQLDGANMRLVVGADTYKITSSVRRDDTRVVELTLRKNV